MSDYLTTAEVAAMFRVKPCTVSKWCSTGKYPKKYLRRTSGDTRGSKWLIHKDALKPKAPYKQINSSNSTQEAINRVYELLEQV
ncbi:MAG: helix-turn-helix domain-containing protein [Thermoguttaceae bacterium]|nr:helix-turn-helix domain-containing protein [Thermoguttaceae bacterium]